jgi:hypothetical protein
MGLAAVRAQPLIRLLQIPVALILSFRQALIKLLMLPASTSAWHFRCFKLTSPLR